jgi:hypothetical protein
LRIQRSKETELAEASVFGSNTAAKPRRIQEQVFREAQHSINLNLASTG